MLEIWRDIKDYEGLYQFSSKGNLKRLVGYGCKTERTVKPFKNFGYLIVRLSKNGVVTKVRVNRLVAMTFPDLVDWTEDAKGKPFEELDVNHKDEDTLNNDVSNLMVCTRRENNVWGSRIKRVNEKLTNGKCSKQILQYTLDMVFIKEYPSISEASRQTGISKSSISKCCQGYSGYKSAGVYIWKYKKI